jgi:hypothetical protein
MGAAESATPKHRSKREKIGMTSSFYKGMGMTCTLTARIAKPVEGEIA